jgi:hypothetical protein
MKTAVCLAAVLLAGPARSGDRQRGFVRDRAAAVRIVVAAWNPAYGKAFIRRERPYHASLRDGVWTVEGTMPRIKVDGRWVRPTHGGVARAEIRQADGRILKVTHGK